MGLSAKKETALSSQERVGSFSLFPNPGRSILSATDSLDNCGTLPHLAEGLGVNYGEPFSVVVEVGVGTLEGLALTFHGISEKPFKSRFHPKPDYQ